MRNVRVQPAAAELHIASFVVQHRNEAAEVLERHIADSIGLELPIRGEVRSVVLCEGEDQYMILDRIDELRAIPGVLNVTLVYHHAEPRSALDAPVPMEAGGMP